MMPLPSPIRIYGSARGARSGYRPTYRAGCSCPTCCGTQWHVGRLTAECAGRSTALPLAIGGAA